MTIPKEVRSYVKAYRHGARCPGCGRNAGETKRPLHFHHIDPSTKKFNVSNSGSRSLEAVKAEIDKCVLICYQCHRKMHERGGHAIAVIHAVGGYATLDIIGSPS